MRVGNLDSESNFLIADITFSHGLHLLLSFGLQPNYIAITIITDCATKIKSFFKYLS